MLVQIKEEFEHTQGDNDSCSTAPSSPPSQDVAYSANSSGAFVALDNISRKRSGCEKKKKSSEEDIEPLNKRFCGNQ